MRLLFVVLLILSFQKGSVAFTLLPQKPSFSTRGPRWEPYEQVSPMDGVRQRGVILRADKPIAPGVYPTLVVGCHDKIAGIIVGLPGVAFGNEFPSNVAHVRIKWGQGAVQNEQWTMRPPEFAYPGWLGAEHIQCLEKVDSVMIEFKLYQLGLVYAEFDLTDKEAALQVARSCR